MAQINTGKLPLIKDEVNKIEILDGGVILHFKSGTTFFGHSYTTERQYENFHPKEKEKQNDSN